MRLTNIDRQQEELLRAQALRNKYDSRSAFSLRYFTPKQHGKAHICRAGFAWHKATLLSPSAGPSFSTPCCPSGSTWQSHRAVLRKLTEQLFLQLQQPPAPPGRSRFRLQAAHCQKPSTYLLEQIVRSASKQVSMACTDHRNKGTGGILRDHQRICESSRILFWTIARCHITARPTGQKLVQTGSPTLPRKFQEAGEVWSDFVWSAEVEHGIGQPGDADGGAVWHAACPLAAPPPLLRLHLQAVAAQVLLGGQARTLRPCFSTVLRDHSPSPQCTPGVMLYPSHYVLGFL